MYKLRKHNQLTQIDEKVITFASKWTISYLPIYAKRLQLNLLKKFGASFGLSRRVHYLPILLRQDLRKLAPRSFVDLRITDRQNVEMQIVDTKIHTYVHHLP
jgi:hypothetical protein